jgi:hypothetical protein
MRKAWGDPPSEVKGSITKLISESKAVFWVDNESYQEYVKKKKANETYLAAAIPAQQKKNEQAIQDAVRKGMSERQLRDLKAWTQDQLHRVEKQIPYDPRGIESAFVLDIDVNHVEKLIEKEEQRFMHEFGNLPGIPSAIAYHSEHMIRGYQPLIVVSW